MTVDELRRLKAAAPAAGAAFTIVAALTASSLLARQAPTAENHPRPALSANAPLPSAEPALKVVAEERFQPAEAASRPPPSAAPASAPPAPAANQSPAGLPGEEVALVVKFKDDGKIKDVVDLFWKDPHAARAKYDRFKSGRPELAETALDRVTYSNELVLIHDRPMAPAALAARMRVIADRLRASADIAYAEADATAHPDDRQ